jgi:inorganic triphosphatase YgiF
MAQYFQNKEIEVEFKFLVEDSRVFDQINDLKKLGDFELKKKRALKIYDRYFDTPDFEVSRNYYCYRLRRQNQDYILAYKHELGLGPNGEHINEELEYKIPEEKVELVLNHEYPNEALEKITARMPKEKLSPQIMVKNNRQVLDFYNQQNHHIEVAFDNIEIQLGDLVPEKELEIEVEAANVPKDLFQQFLENLFNQIGSVKPIEYSKLSRVLMRHGYSLAKLKVIED